MNNKDILHKIKHYIFLFVIGLVITSCSKDSYEAKQPAYISIPSITLTTNYATQGSASSNIKDAWVFVNDNLIGVFELPAKFPILREGDVTIKIFAGIKDNGISADGTRYLMYDPHIEYVNLKKGETIEINAMVTYAAGVNFTWIEDFENPSLSFLYHANSDTIINKQSTIVKEGGFSGEIVLKDQMTFFEATSVAYNSVPLVGATPVYLELDFITNEPLNIGVYLGINQFAFIKLNTTTTWKKIYINLTDVINQNNSFNPADMKVFFGIKEASSPFLTSQPQIYIDNIKLIHL